ncbi:MAG: hypothetical protein ACRDH1_01975 [Actinomycetota bacterium]
MAFRLFPAIVVLAVALSACSGDAPAPEATPPLAGAGPEEGTPPPATGKELVGECVNGYTAPVAGDPARTEALRVLARATDRPMGRFDVVDMRYFEGPESPPSEREYLLRVRRWYVKATLRGEESFAGRFLIEKRSFGGGVVAVAPFDTAGIRSPDWVGFLLVEGGEPVPYPGLPGEWAGDPYDFVTGRDPETSEEIFGFPGLPLEVAGCLQGT